MRKISGWLAVGALLALGGEAFGQGRGGCGNGGGMRPQMSGGPQMSAGNYGQQLQAYQRQSAMAAQQQYARQLQAQQMLALQQAQQQQLHLLQAQQWQAQQLAAARAKQVQLRGGN